jgi:hypothetical protein
MGPDVYHERGASVKRGVEQQNGQSSLIA